jgi:hypothetical protein
VSGAGELGIAADRASAIVTDALARAPRLIPICAHRYMPDSPVQEGNPVFSVWQTDIICYGTDLSRYLACEFKALTPEEAVAGSPRTIPFWSALAS